MVRIFPYAATQFTAFEIYKKVSLKHFHNSNVTRFPFPQYLSKLIGDKFIIQHADKFFAGAGAGLTAVTLTYPLDTIRARLAFQVTGEHKYRGIAHTAVTIFKEVSFDDICTLSFFV